MFVFSFRLSRRDAGLLLRAFLAQVFVLPLPPSVFPKTVLKALRFVWGFTTPGFPALLGDATRVFVSFAPTSKFLSAHHEKLPKCTEIQEEGKMSIAQEGIGGGKRDEYKMTHGVKQ